MVDGANRVDKLPDAGGHFTDMTPLPTGEWRLSFNTLRESPAMFV